MEDFRSKAQSIGEALFLDDPHLELLNAEGLKAWFDLAEGGRGRARYHDATFMLNQPRVLATNAIKLGTAEMPAEPKPNEEFKPEDYGVLNEQRTRKVDIYLCE